MSQQSTDLNTDTENVRTSASYADVGDGVSRWFHWNRVADGGHATTGLKADAAVSDPTASGSVIALLKGLLKRPTQISNTVLATNLVVKASAGRLIRLVITNTNAAGRYFQVHNTASLPADGVAPALLVYVPATTTLVVDYGAAGVAFTTGITVCNSTTAATKTVAGADAWVDALYE